MIRAIIAVSSGGLATALKIARELPGDIFAPEKYCREPARPLPCRLKEFMGDIFQNYREIILVMSCGIAVRSIASYLESKVKDPAVVVLDETGHHVISLLSGHLGGANELAAKVADVTGGTAVITTASDNLGLEAVDMLAKKHGLVIEDMEAVKKVTSVLINGGKAAVIKDGWQGPVDDRIVTVTWEELEQVCPDALIYIGNRRIPKKLHLEIPAASLRIPKLVLGVGCRRGTNPEDLFRAVEELFQYHGLALKGIKAVATIDVKKDEKAIICLAERLGVPLKIVERQDILPIESRFVCSDFVKKSIGVGCACEPAAYLVSGAGTCLIPKTSGLGITLSVFEEVAMKGKVYVIGLGPGGLDQMTMRAYKTIESCQVLVGYTVYIEQVQELCRDKEIIKKGMGQEVERGKIAIEKALEGKTVGVVCSGDAGLYGMAGLILELWKNHPDRDRVTCEVVPGITSALSCSSLLGAPIVEDFCTISLSDYMTPWERIISRLEHACAGDFTIALYNPRSLARPDYLEKALQVVLRYRSGDTPVGIVCNAYREGQSVTITTLEKLDPEMVNMFCTLIIGNSKTYLAEGKMITSRGYQL